MRSTGCTPRSETSAPRRSSGTVEVLGRTPPATASIWRYLLDVDWTQAVVARLQPVDSPLFLLLARPNFSRPTIADGIWIRLVDVGGALSGRAYAGDGAVVLEVHDEFCAWNAGRWRVEAGQAVRTSAAADLALDVADLGSVYLGGFAFRDSGGRDWSRSGATARLTVRMRCSERTRRLVP